MNIQVLLHYLQFLKRLQHITTQIELYNFRNVTYYGKSNTS